VDTTLQIKFDDSDDDITVKKDGIICFLDRFNFKMNEDGDIGGICRVIEVGGDGVVPPADDDVAADDDVNVTKPDDDAAPADDDAAPAVDDDAAPAVDDDAPPVEQTTEEEPGFEAVFAIAGLLAVAYLVLRKRE